MIWTHIGMRRVSLCKFFSVAVNVTQNSWFHVMEVGEILAKSTTQYQISINKKNKPLQKHF